MGWCPQYYGLHDKCLVWYYVYVGLIVFAPGLNYLLEEENLLWLLLFMAHRLLLVS